MTSSSLKSTSINLASLAPKLGGDLIVKEASFPTPNPNEIVVESKALGINPFDWIVWIASNLATSWLTFPAVLGTDVAGEVVAVGSAVTKFKVGDRVLSLAVGMDKDVNSPARGAFQSFPIVSESLTSKIPDTLSYEEASVLPLGIATASAGLFQKDHLALKYPQPGNVKPKGETILVWGGSTSVGINAIQLAVAAGYDVIATSSPRNFNLLKSLGASAAFDYNSATVVKDISSHLQTKPKVSGAIALGMGSAEACVAIIGSLPSIPAHRKFVSIATGPFELDKFFAHRRVPLSAMPGIVGGLLVWVLKMTIKTTLKGVKTNQIWGTDVKKSEVGKAIFEDFLPEALGAKTFRALPEPFVVGHGLESIQAGFEAQVKGVSAKKVVSEHTLRGIMNVHLLVPGRSEKWTCNAMLV
ncbi:GroES-like protein [Meredithblackwellia eburnea MCA 4105]